MNFHFEKIGPIDSADLELGDFTLIAGRNNTGKTYIVYTMYGFLRTWLNFIDPVRSWAEKSSSNSLPERLHEFLQGPAGQTQFFSLEDLEEFRNYSLGQIGSQFSQYGISRTFGSPHKEFSNSSFSVNLKKLQIDKLAVKFMLYQPVTGEQIEVTYRKSGVVLKLFKISNKPNHTLDSTCTLLLDIAFPDMLHPFILSAERFGIALFYKELDFTKNRLVEVLQQFSDTKGLDHDLPLLVLDRMSSRYAMPVRDNIDFTRNISEVRDDRSQLHDYKLHDKIRKLMSGYYVVARNDIRFKSKALKNRIFDIPLYLASSSARGLSDLYFYLRNKASDWNQLLIIDEPESHLDTANQVQLARILAHFVRLGIKILVTTHSDYLIKEVNNLIMLGHIDGKQNRGLARRLGYGSGEHLRAGSVRAYVAEGNGLTRCKVDRYGVEMPVFDKTIDDINHVANELATAISATEPTKNGRR